MILCITVDNMDDLTQEKTTVKMEKLSKNNPLKQPFFERPLPDASQLNAKNIVAFLENLFTQYGASEYLGEPVTMAQHMLQAADLAQQTGQDETIIAAALLHDIGHFTSEWGMFTLADEQDRYHEAAGAEVLAAFFPEEVVECVRHHVAAKRYLCATRPAYFKQLSPASVHSLNLQGGPMNQAEVNEFAKNPYLSAIIQVRYLDDAGKQASRETPAFSHFMPLLQRLVVSR